MRYGAASFDPQQWIYGKDDTSPVSIEAFAPPAHPDVTGMWAWVELTYSDGFTFVMDRPSGAPQIKKPQNRSLYLNLEKDQQKINAMPDPEPLLSFPEAVKQRKQAGGHL